MKILKRRKLRVLTEASGALTAGYILNNIKDSGAQAIASDIFDFGYHADFGAEFLKVPRSDEPTLWSDMKDLVAKHKIDVVFPSLDETLLGWANHLDDFANIGCDVILSPQKTIEICQDKWKTYNFFVESNIPTPATSLNQEYPLIKPRDGRGGKGIIQTIEPVSMDNMISQELVYGQEYTVDVLFDHRSKPIYIIPRRRLDVRDGKSTKGFVEKNEEIEIYIHKMASALEFYGPVNFQCFVGPEGITFIEINPRLAGGMALGFAASENWIDLVINKFRARIDVTPKNIKYGLGMVRYYNDFFFPKV